MAGAGRVGDRARGTSGAGKDVQGAAASGSPDVFVNGRAALRVEDAGSHDEGGSWRARIGSTGVFIDGKPAFRVGDASEHGGDGELVEGSADVSFGDARPGTVKDKPHDKSVKIDVVDGLGRPLHDVKIRPFCPHGTQLPELTVDGGATVSGLCSGSSITLDKSLQTGEWDPNAVPFQARSNRHVDPAGGDATVVQPAPAASGSSSGTVNVARPTGNVHVIVPTVHNWVELVYRAFKHHIPTGAKHLALLGVREASLASATARHPSTDGLEWQAGHGGEENVDFTREKRTSRSYNDLLFCVWTDSSVNKHQHVEVFECSIDASAGPGPLHLPQLLEGKLFHAKPGSYRPHEYPGKHTSLHVSLGGKPETAAATPQEVLQVAEREVGTIEQPVNLQKYGAWYGANGVYWCAEFVSWVFAHAGMPLIHYAYCPTGAGEFKSGAWGHWVPTHEHAEPGDIVFYQFNGPGTLYDHTGIVVHDDGGSITTIEGNTSPPGGSGSQSNGGGVYRKVRPKDSMVGGFGRPRFQKHHDDPVPVIRWGSEHERLRELQKGQTLLHHHYFEKDKHGHMHPAKDAVRYKKFMSIYEAATNKKAIPYLVASSQHLKTYTEWAEWVTAHPGKTPEPKSVVRESALHAPAGHAHKYVPSFFTKAYADRVLAHASTMHDRHHAAEIRTALVNALARAEL